MPINQTVETDRKSCFQSDSKDACAPKCLRINTKQGSQKSCNAKDKNLRNTPSGRKNVRPFVCLESRTQSSLSFAPS